MGKIWEKETMERIGALCWKHHVVVISDEIHCELTDPGKEYIPFASVSEECKENSITCIAPTKAFNLAGIQTAAVMVPDPYLRHQMGRALNTDEVAEPNVFAMTAAIAAYREGGPWLDGLRAYLYENKQTAKAFLEQELPDIHLVESEATYLLWLDCRELVEDTEELEQVLCKETGLYLSNGGQYGESGKSFLRMNIACAHTVLEDGLERLKTGVQAWKDCRADGRNPEPYLGM